MSQYSANELCKPLLLPYYVFPYHYIFILPVYFFLLN
jgi:hypothetical protein